MDFSKCQCQHAGWCNLFKKEMTFDPPNWQWCQSLPEDQRESYYNSLRKSCAGSIIKKARNDNEVDIIHFYDELPAKINDCAICVVAPDDKSLELLKITRNNIQLYAKKCNADYIELTGNQIPDYPIYNKFRIYQVTQVYKKTLYVDCDIVIKNCTPNIFELTPDDKISAFDEFAEYLSEGRQDWAKFELEKAIAKFNLEHKKNTMLNSGFIVIPKSCADYYKQPSQPYYKSWVFDQVYLTLCTPESKLNRIGKEWNNTYDLNCFIDNINLSYINHINTGNKADKHKDRKKILQTLVDIDLDQANYELNEDLPIIVTSISSNINSFTRQIKAIKTWKQNGFYVISCNTSEEIDKLKKIYTLIDEFKEVKIQEAEGFKSSPNIYDLCQVAHELNQNIILTNSDIEICDVNTISIAVKNMKNREMIIGIRHNYDELEVARERYGIDFYVITPEMARSIPRLEQRIGMPFWDYWLVAHFFIKNYNIKVLSNKFLLHELHPLNWSQENWNTGHKNFKSYYNETITSIIGYGHHFRSCLGDGPDRFHTLAFDHIPKTAGTTIVQWLCEPQGHYDFRDKELRYISNNIHDAEYFVQNLPTHMQKMIRLVHGHYIWPLIDYCNENRFIFTTIRDPFDRFISHISYIIEHTKYKIKNISDYIREVADHYFFIYYNHMTCNGTVDWKLRVNRYNYIDNHDSSLRISKMIRLAFPNQVYRIINHKLNTCDTKIKLSNDDIIFVKNGLEQEYEIYNYMKSKMKEINCNTLNLLKLNLHEHMNYYDNNFFKTSQEALDFIEYDDDIFDEFR